MTIRFEYQPSFGDYLRLHGYIAARAIGPWGIACIWVVGATALGVLKLLEIQSPLVYPLYFITMIPVFLLPLGSFLYHRAREQWKSSEAIRESRTYTIHESGITLEGADEPSEIRWSQIKSADRFLGLLLLETAETAFLYFPVRCLPDPRAFTEFVASRAIATRAFIGTGPGRGTSPNPESGK